MRPDRVRCGIAVAVLMLGHVAAVEAVEVGMGFASEPIDISGGGTFIDLFFEFPFAPITSVRSTLSVGPWPIQLEIFLLDVMGILEFRWGDFRPYVGLGAGIGAPLERPTKPFPVARTTAGMNIIITPTVAVTVHINQYLFSYRQFTTFFSPGFAFKIRL